TALNRRILDERDTKQLFSALVETAARLCGAERAFLAFFPAASGAAADAVEVLAARGIDAEELRSSKQRFSRSVAKRAAESGEPVVTADVRATAPAPRDEKHPAVIGQGLRSVLAAPVRTRDGRH